MVHIRLDFLVSANPLLITPGNRQESGQLQGEEWSDRRSK